MAEMKKDLQAELELLYEEFGLVQTVNCTSKDNKMYKKMLDNGEQLPDGVHQYMGSNGDNPLGEFYVRFDNCIDDNKKEEYINLKKLSYLRSIKNSLVFFVVLTILSILGTIIILLK